MALAVLINAQTAVVAVAGATAFSPTGAFLIDASGLKPEEYVLLYKLFSDGAYHPATDKSGVIKLSDNPNNVIVDAPGTYKLVKPTITAAVTAGWEEI